MSYVLAALAALGLYYFYNRSSTGDSVGDQNGWVPLHNPFPLDLTQIMAYAKPNIGVRFVLTHPNPSGSAILNLTALAEGVVLEVQESGGKRYWKVRLDRVGYGNFNTKGEFLPGKLLDGTPFSLPDGVKLPNVGAVFALTDDNFFA